MDASFYNKQVLRFAVIIVIIYLIMIFLNYIFQSTAIYKMMKSRKIKGAFLSWIPITYCYALGSIYDSIKRENGEKTYFRFAILFIHAAFLILQNSVLTRLISKLIHTIQHNLNSEVLPIMRDYISNSSINFLPGLLASTQTVLCFVCIYTIFKTYAPTRPSYFAVSLIFTLMPIVPFIPGIYLLKTSKNSPVCPKKLSLA